MYCIYRFSNPFEILSFRFIPKYLKISQIFASIFKCRLFSVRMLKNIYSLFPTTTAYGRTVEKLITERVKDASRLKKKIKRYSFQRQMVGLALTINGMVKKSFLQDLILWAHRTCLVAKTPVRPRDRCTKWRSSTSGKKELTSPSLL